MLSVPSLVKKAFLRFHHNFHFDELRLQGYRLSKSELRAVRLPEKAMGPEGQNEQNNGIGDYVP